jgi:exopolysaccharide production protein ExoZ
MKTPQHKKMHMASIQMLRAVAALLVLFMHELYIGFPPSAAIFPQPAISGAWQLKSLGGCGVHIFFVISGFIMAHLAGQDRNGSLAAFLLDRVTRIAPLYWLTTVFWIAYMPHIDWWFVAQSLSFIPVSGYFPANGVGWTLNMEAYFYLSFGIVVIYLRRSTAWLAAVFAIMTLLHFGFPQVVVFELYSNPLVWLFLAGIVIYHIRAHSTFIRCRYLIFSASIAGFAYSAYSYIPAHTWSEGTFVHWGIPAALLVLSMTSIEAAGGIKTSTVTRVLGKIGDASYSLYLCHLIVVAMLNKHILLAMKAMNIAVLIAFMFTAVLSALAIHRWIEKPLTKVARTCVNRLVMRATKDHGAVYRPDEVILDRPEQATRPL